MKEPALSVSLGHRLILFYRVSGACPEMALLSDKAGEDGVHSVTCKCAKKKGLSKFYFQLQGIC